MKTTTTKIYSTPTCQVVSIATCKAVLTTSGDLGNVGEGNPGNDWHD